MSELDGLTDAMTARGLIPPAHFEPGKIQRVAESDHPKSDTAGWVRLFPDGQGATFGSHRGGWQETWQAKRDKPMDAKERREFQKQIREARKAAEDEREREYLAAAKEAEKRWEAGSPAPADNAYLVMKQVSPFDTRQDGHGNLLVPVHDASGGIQSLQTIRPDGEKRFLKNGRMGSGRFWLQEPAGDDAPVLLAEGFATAASIATAFPEAGVVAAFSAKNLKPVAESLRDQHQARRIVICGDNDESGTGQAAAQEAAQAIGATVALPDTAGTDWNDAYIRDGAAAVRDAIGDAMDAPGPQRRPYLLLDNGKWPEALDTAMGGLQGVFDYGGALVAIDQGGGTLPLTTHGLCDKLNRQFKVMKYDARRDEHAPVQTPAEFASQLLAIRDSWAFPKLAAVTTHRVLRPDGSVLDRPGYDAETGLYLKQRGPWTPMPADLKMAVETLWFPVSQMPYVSPADAGATLALMLTAVQRAVLPLAPLFITSAPVFGSGKTAIGEVASLLAGGDASVTPWPAQPEEQQKSILAALVGAQPCILVDNVSGQIGGDHLAACLTTERYRGRILGQTAQVAVPTRCLWVATGINIGPTADLGRRSLTIRLDPHVENPELRKFTFDPKKWALEHLAEMQAAAITILRATRQHDAPPLGSFGGWDRQVRQAVLTVIDDGLAPCPMADPLETMARERESDPEVETLGAILNSWNAMFGDRLVPLVDVVSRAKESVDRELITALDAVAGNGREDINLRRLGKYLKRHESRIIDGLMVRKGEKTYLGLPWCVRSKPDFHDNSDFSLYPRGKVSNECSNDSLRGECETQSGNTGKSGLCPRCDGEGCPYCAEVAP